MRSVALVYPASRADAVAYACRAASILNEAGARVLLCEAAPEAAIPGAFPMANEKPDAFLSLGGDGTLLRAAQLAMAADVPLLGINLGRLGFLAETEPDDLEAALQQLLRGDYTLDERATLLVTVPGIDTWYGLNDAVISRGGYARLITIHTLVDGEETGCYMADGVIVATPTGSTGYSLSAGGPIVSPHVDCMVITPVCAHSLQHRPAVVPGNAEIVIELEADDVAASLQVDGQSCTVLRRGQRVELRRDPRSVKLVRLKDMQFFNVVRHKLVEWSR